MVVEIGRTVYGILLIRVVEISGEERRGEEQDLPVHKTGDKVSVLPHY